MSQLTNLFDRTLSPSLSALHSSARPSDSVGQTHPDDHQVTTVPPVTQHVNVPHSTNGETAASGLSMPSLPPKKATRGRPRKNPVLSDTVRRGRGRPRLNATKPESVVRSGRGRARARLNPTKVDSVSRRGRPRIHPPKVEPLVRRPRGRPRKDSSLINVLGSFVLTTSAQTKVSCNGESSSVVYRLVQAGASTTSPERSPETTDLPSVCGDVSMESDTEVASEQELDSAQFVTPPTTPTPAEATGDDKATNADVAAERHETTDAGEATEVDERMSLSDDKSTSETCSVGN
jgi:hypothetical protein